MRIWKNRPISSASSSIFTCQRTERAQRTLFFARYEAGQVGSVSTEPEHLRLGLRRENPAIFVKVLERPSIFVDPTRKPIASFRMPRAKIPISVDIRLGKECKRISLYAREVADGLGHSCVGTEHLPLGLLQDENCPAALFPKEAGVTIAKVRTQMAGQP